MHLIELIMLCPACGHNLPQDAYIHIERHRDRIAGKDYKLLRCPECRVIFTEPRDPVGSDWYTRAFTLGIIERSPVDMNGWRARNFRSHGLARGKLLDVGCGDGGFLNVARELGYKVSGFDFDPHAVEKARARGLDAWVSDFDTAFEDIQLHGAFDVITLFDVLEHVPEPATFLLRAKQLIKPGGHMVFTMPDDSRPHPWNREELDYPPNHYTRWTKDSLRSFLDRHGLRVVLINSDPIDARNLAGQMFFNFLMPKCLPVVKRLIFAGGGRSADSALSITEQYERAQADSRTSATGSLADKGFRMQLVNTAFLIFQALVLPITWPAALWYRLVGCGHTLYALACVPIQRDIAT